MLEPASLGAKVLQIRSVEIAMKYSVPIHVRSSFNEQPGTIVTKEDSTWRASSSAEWRTTRERRAARRRRRRSAGHRGRALREDRREEHLGRHDRPERDDRRRPARRHHVPTLAKTDLARAKPLVETVAKGIGAREVRYDEDGGQGIDRRLRDAIARGHRRKDVPDPRQRRDRFRRSPRARSA